MSKNSNKNSDKKRKRILTEEEKAQEKFKVFLLEMDNPWCGFWDGVSFVHEFLKEGLLRDDQIKLALDKMGERFKTKYEEFFVHLVIPLDKTLHYLKVLHHNINFEPILFHLRFIPLNFYEENKDVFDVNVFKRLVPKYYKLNEEFLLKYEKELDWSTVATYQTNIPDYLIERNLHRIRNVAFTIYAVNSGKTYLLRKYPHKIRWSVFIFSKEIKNPPLDFIGENMNKFKPRYFKVYLPKFRKLTAGFIEKFVDHLSWPTIISKQKHLPNNFFEKHRTRIDKTIFAKALPKYQRLSPDFIDRHAHELDWKVVIQYQTHLPTWLIEKHKNRIDKQTFSILLPRHHQLTLNFIRKYAEQLSWREIVTHQSNLSESIIENFMQRIKKENALIPLLINQKLSLNFLEKHWKLIGWKNILLYVKLPIKFIEKNLKHMDEEEIRDYLPRYQKLNPAFIEKYEDFLNLDYVFEYQTALPEKLESRRMLRKISHILRKRRELDEETDL